MNKKIAFFAAAMAVAVPVFAQAENTANTAAKAAREENQAARKELAQQKDQMKIEIQTKKAEFKDAKEKMTEQRCKNIETRVSTRIGRYENNQQMLQRVYSNMTTRIERLISKLDAAGADTAKLKTDFATLKTMIDKAYADNTTFINSLKTTQEFACGKSEGEFKTKIGEARTVLPIVKEDRIAIKNFFQTTIKDDLQAIRSSLPKESAEVENETEAKKVNTPDSTPAAETPTPVTSTPATTAPTTPTGSVQ